MLKFIRKKKQMRSYTQWHYYKYSEISCQLSIQDTNNWRINKAQYIAADYLKYDFTFRVFVLFYCIKLLIYSVNHIPMFFFLSLKIQ